MISIPVAALGLFAAIALVAAWSDLRRLEIPNRLPLLIAGLYPVYAASAPVPVDALGAAAVAAALLIGGFGLFARGLVGAGDVKLMAAGGLWAGLDLGGEFVVLTTLVGGLIALGLLTPWGDIAIARIRVAGLAVPSDGRVHRRPMPYGVAIALALLVVAAQRLGQA